MIHLVMSSLILGSSGWRDAVIVIWPDAYDFPLRYTLNHIHKACEKITLASRSGQPSLQEISSLIDYVLSQSAKKPQLITLSICQAAMAWKGPSLWFRAVRESTVGLAAFENFNAVWDAIITFGFESVQEE